MSKRNSIFQNVVREKVSQSTHNIGYVNRLSMDPGKLYPVYIQQTIPGDVFYGGSGMFMRSQPLVSPLLTNVNIEMRYFWVPNRMVWHNWIYFLTDQDKVSKYDGKHPFNGTFPTITLTDENDVARGTLADYLGVSPNYPNMPHDGVGAVPAINALPFRAYWLIWNEYFRDESLQAPVNFNYGDSSDDIWTGDGQIPSGYCPGDLLYVCWKKDRFTSALPWTQKGEDVDLDMLVAMRNKRIKGTDYNAWVKDNSPKFVTYESDPDDNTYLRANEATGVNSEGNLLLGAAVQTIKSGEFNGTSIGNIRAREEPGGGFNPARNNLATSIGRTLFFDPNGSLGTQVSIRRIRQAAALQRILEKKAVAGSRYSEYLLSMYGVRIPDAEIGRPVYLGGGVNPLNVSPVEQMSQTGDTPQGNLAGKGVSIGSYHLSRPWLFNDFGYVMGVAYIRPEAEYCDGMRRDLLIYDRESFYNPDYQLLGEEQVYQFEIAANNVNPMGEAGYQQRYAWLKSRENEVHGELVDTSLKSYVAPRRFDLEHEVYVNSSFVTCAPDMSSNFAYDGSDKFIVEVNNMIMARRPMYFVPIQRPGLL